MTIIIPILETGNHKSGGTRECLRSMNCAVPQGMKVQTRMFLWTQSAECAVGFHIIVLPVSSFKMHQ